MYPAERAEAASGTALGVHALPSAVAVPLGRDPKPALPSAIRGGAGQIAAPRRATPQFATSGQAPSLSGR
ncbi:hypothetical protein GCM10010994_39480 [Chelatococcus reniformis]|uniref:Uncharacterized protein n=1 Tax=Chelatococcus reniformis TaxID=1494448 RepID=A0A916UMG0_9HYPH|nr:hypothetical protein GCM10010994_39480 [Chelatococcus reniformis]